MVEQKFYQSQPEVLPATLPAGARNCNGIVFLSEMRLNGECYNGRVRFVSGAEEVGDVHIRTVDWASVPVAQLEPADRPIQAGDWVECVNQGTATFLRQGEKYLIESVQALDGNRRLQLLGSAIFWREFRFKRVEGPHSESAPEREPCCMADAGGYACSCPRPRLHPDKLCAGCEQPVGYCAENCPDRSRENSSVPVGTGNAQSSGMGEKCRSCSSGVALPKHDYCVYCSNRFEKDEGAFSFDDDDSTALFVGLASEQPRVSAATRKMLAGGHPWEEFDELESR
ncbi:MAG TPA: hypothetical protein VER11_34335 [Polyangiaceae bacterium]|nr:hypothetical protein [Polyangiaceae bacterium]